MSTGEDKLAGIMQDALIIDDCISVIEIIDRMGPELGYEPEASEALHRVMRTSVERILVSVDRQKAESAGHG